MSRGRQTRAAVPSRAQREVVRLTKKKKSAKRGLSRVCWRGGKSRNTKRVARLFPCRVLCLLGFLAFPRWFLDGRPEDHTRASDHTRTPRTGAPVLLFSGRRNRRLLCVAGHPGEQTLPPSPPRCCRGGNAHVTEPWCIRTRARPRDRGYGTKPELEFSHRSVSPCGGETSRLPESRPGGTTGCLFRLTLLRPYGPAHCAQPHKNPASPIAPFILSS